MPVYCPNCGAGNRDTARFCMQCSASLTTPLPAQEQVCANCGTRNPTAASYCLHCATPLHASTPAAGLTGLLPQNYLLSGRYLIVKRLGKGGMGAVYQASDTRISGKLWAIKEMSDAALLDPADKQQARDAFQREAQMLALLDHVNLPKVNDFFMEGGKLYLVMDFIDGQTLQALLEARPGPFPEAQVLDWAGQLCDALDYLHRCTPPIIFRDLKPDNIMVDRSNRVTLIDFGVARLFKVGKQRDTESFGTAGYAPSEQYGKGQTDARSDIYALGVTLHQLLTGYDPTLTPFNLPPARNVNPAVSAQIEQVIIKATQPLQANRYQNALEFKAALLTAPKPQVKTTVTAPPPQIYRTVPMVQPVTINPPAVVPSALPNPSQSTTARRVSIQSFWSITIALGLLFGLLYTEIGWSIVTSHLSDLWFISGVALSIWFLAGPLAYALLRRPGSFLIAWVIAHLVFSASVQGTLAFDAIWSNPRIYLAPIVFEIIIAACRQKSDSSLAVTLATILAVLSSELAGSIFFGWNESITLFIVIAEAGLITGFIGNWLGRLFRKRIGWA